jgi:hypothetical protein
MVDVAEIDENFSRIEESKKMVQCQSCWILRRHHEKQVKLSRS